MGMAGVKPVALITHAELRQRFDCDQVGEDNQPLQVNLHLAVPTGAGDHGKLGFFCGLDHCQIRFGDNPGFTHGVDIFVLFGVQGYLVAGFQIRQVPKRTAVPVCQVDMPG